MASASCQGHETKPSGCGMLRLASRCGHLWRDMSVLSTVLHSRRMASASCRGQRTRLSGCGMSKVANHCSHLSRDMGLVSVLLHFRRMEITPRLDLRTSQSTHTMLLANLTYNTSYVSLCTSNMLLLMLSHFSTKSLLRRKK